MASVVRSITIVIVLSMSELVSGQGCIGVCLNPLSDCSCDCDTQGRGWTLNCRNLGLSTLPTITPSATLFYELTFMNTNDPDNGDCTRCNQITSLPASAFSGLRVTRIDLRNNALTQIDINAFLGTEMYTQELLIEGNKIIAPPFDAMARIPGLTLLDMEDFEMQSIPANNKFSNFPQLKTLVLRSMKINEISNNAFVNKLNSLIKLELSDNPLRRIPVGALRELVSLKQLAISQCQVSVITIDAFARLRSLTELDLQHNSIHTLETACFNGLGDNLQYLGLHLNSLDENNLRPLFDQNFHVLTQLNLGQNPIRTIPARSFFQMPSLAYLNLDYNLIESINEQAFEGLPQLYHLELSFNKLTNIAAGTFDHNPILAELDLEEQHPVLPEQPPSNVQLDFTFAAVRNLTRSLLRLNLKKTKLVQSNAWDAIKQLTSLENLDLSETGLTAIPDFTFAQLGKLKDLYLAGNNIQMVTQKSFHGLKNRLTNLDLQGNSLSSIDNCILEGFTRLELLYLGGNPMQCNCGLLWLYDWILAKSQSSENSFLPYIVHCSCANLGDALLDPVVLGKNDICPQSSNYVDPECETYHLTTLAPSPTSKDTGPTVPMPVLNLQNVNATINSITVGWSVSDARYVTAFQLWYTVLTDGNYEAPVKTLHKVTRSFTIPNLLEDTRYEVCVVVEIQESTAGTPHECTFAQTRSSKIEPVDPNDGEKQSDNTIPIIAGTVVGGVILIVLIVLIIYFLKCRRPPAKKLSDREVAANPKHVEGGKMDNKAKKYTRGANPALNDEVTTEGAKQMNRYTAMDYSKKNANKETTDYDEQNPRSPAKVLADDNRAKNPARSAKSRQRNPRAPEHVNRGYRQDQSPTDPEDRSPNRRLNQQGVYVNEAFGVTDSQEYIDINVDSRRLSTSSSVTTDV